MSYCKRCGRVLDSYHAMNTVVKFVDKNNRGKLKIIMDGCLCSKCLQLAREGISQIIELWREM